MSVLDQEHEATSLEPTWRRALQGWLTTGEPHPTRGPFARWPRSTDSALAVFVFAVSMGAVSLSALGDGEEFTTGSISEQPAGAVALLAMAAVALLWRRRRPIATTGLILTVMVVWAVAGYGDGQDLALVVAIYTVGRYETDPRRSLAAMVIVASVSILDTIIDPNQRIDVVPALVLTGLPWYVGHRIRNRGDYVALLQERAERLEADQAARARQAVADERTRIARELHDVVAHQVSMMTVQAGAAKTIAHDDLDVAVEAMGEVERAGREALGELRHLLGVLRPDPADHDELGPQPGLADIPNLVDHLARAGCAVTLELADIPSLSAAVELSAYRIVQESLTNIVKHAGPRPTVDVVLQLDGDALIIEITNTTRATPPANLPSSGYGIAGMQERASLLGGTLIAAAIPPGRFHVRALLPVGAESP